MVSQLRLSTKVLVCAVCATLLGALLYALAASSGTRPRLNVLLVSIDSLRHDHLGCYGYARPTSPTIDALARDGARFREAVAPSSWTLPSHVTLLTAKPPEQHGVTDPTKRLEAGTLTLARVLRDAGYRTAAFVASPFLRTLYGYADGFEVYDETLAAKSNLASHSGVTSPGLVAQTTQWLRQWHESAAKQPFFVFLHMWDVHYDFDPPPPYDTMFDPDYRGTVDGRNFELGTQVHAGMDPRDLAHVIALYDGEIRYTDEHLGKVIALLGDLGVLDDTLIIVASDHGEEFFEHGFKGHGKTLYDETIRIPLVARLPGRIPAGAVIEQQVRLMDVAPTILGFAGVAAPPGFGAGDVPQRERDLSTWLTASQPEQPFPELVAFGDLTLRGRPWHSARTPALKSIVIGQRYVSRERYDLVADPGEKTDLLAGGAPAERFAGLESGADAWLAYWSDRHQLAASAPVDAEHLARLRALGYVK